MLLVANIASAQCELVTNGSFENGNVGFTSDLNFSPIFDPGNFNIVANAQNAAGGLNNVSAQDGGVFLVADGGTINPTEIWGQSINVCVGQTYTFCFWYSDVHDGYATPPSFNVAINGTNINAAPIVANGNAWAQYCVTWVATSSTANLQILQNVFIANGNDYGIDNISFQGPCTCEQPFCMYIEKLNDRDLGRAVVATSDGGFIAVGDLHQSSADRDVYVVKYDENMVMQFAKRIGDAATSIFQESGMSVLPVEDGYLVAVTTMSSTNNYDAALFKLNLTGALMWSQRYTANGTNRDDYATKVVRVLISGNYRYFLVGYTNSFSTSTTDYNIFMMGFQPGDGFPVCGATYYYGSANSSEKAFDAITDNTNSHIIIAGEFASASGNRDMYALKINPTNMSVAGSLLVQGTGIESASSLVQAANNNQDVFIAGKTTSNASNDAIYLVKVDLATFTVFAGNAIGYTTVSPNIQEWASGITRTADNNLLVVGGNRLSNGLLMKVDQNLNVLFSKSSNLGSNNDQFLGVTEEIDGEIVQVGSYGPTLADDEFYLSRANSLGVSCCNDNISFQTFSMLNQKTQHDLKNVCFVKNVWGLSANYHNEFYVCPVNGLPRISYTEPAIPQEVDAKRNPNLTIQPNPSNGSFRLTSTETIERIVIYDISGRIIKTIAANGDLSVNVDLSDLNPGTYFIQSSNASSQQLERFVISK